MATAKTKHDKGDVIRIKTSFYKCICADEDTAVFAPSTATGKSVRFIRLFAINRNFKDGNVANYELIIQGHDGKRNTKAPKKKI